MAQNKNYKQDPRPRIRNVLDTKQAPKTLCSEA